MVSSSLRIFSCSLRACSSSIASRALDEAGDVAHPQDPVRHALGRNSVEHSIARHADPLIGLPTIAFHRQRRAAARVARPASS